MSAIKSESAIRDAVEAILRRKKVWESSALKTAKLRQEQQTNRANNNNSKEREQSAKKAREAATAKSNEIRNELNKLFLQQNEIETSVRHQWKEKIGDYEKCSYQDEKDELETLLQEHENEMKQLMEKVKVEQEADDQKKLTMTSNSGTGKRKAEVWDAGGESSKKKQKVDTSTIEKHDHEKAGVIDTERSGDVEKKESIKKEKELEKIVYDMSYLNKTKSQMIWLLKQVITAEKSLKR